VGEVVGRRAEVIGGRIGEEIADSRRVQAGVVFYLRAKEGVFVAFFEQGAPSRMKVSVDILLEPSAEGDEFVVSLKQGKARFIE
jgi:hypothetical protein